jgi:hypothetical protein
VLSIFMWWPSARWRMRPTTRRAWSAVAVLLFVLEALPLLVFLVLVDEVCACDDFEAAEEDHVDDGDSLLEDGCAKSRVAEGGGACEGEWCLRIS